MNRTGYFYFLIFLGIIVPELSCTSKLSDTKGSKCSLTVHVKNVSDTAYAKVAWLHLNNNTFVIEEKDSIPVVHGKFSFECTIERLTSASICINNNYMRIYLEPGDIMVSLDGSAPYNVSQEGSSVDDELAMVNSFLMDNSKRAINKYFNQFSGLVNHIDSQEAFILGERERRETNEQRMMMLLNFCQAHMDFKIVPDLLHQVLLLAEQARMFGEGKALDTQQIESIYQEILSDNKNSDFYYLLGWEIKQVKYAASTQNKVGGEAPDIHLKTIDGEQIRLYDYLDDNFILLHFGGERKDFQRLADYYNIPKLNIISITQNCMPDEEKEYVQFVDGRWPVSISDFDLSYYGMRLLNPASVYSSFGFKSCTLISPSRVVIGRWKDVEMPTSMEIDVIMGSCENHGVGSSDHFSK